MDDANLANVLGAVATRLSDVLRSAIEASGHDASAAAALVHLSKYPGATIDALRAPLELTHSGCVRLVDRLTVGGLLSRKPAEDARAVALTLTRKGRDAAADILRRREVILLGALGPLPAADREALARILGRLLPNEVPTLAVGLRTCRYCDYDACRACPLTSG